jgi:hypothetical protein
MSVNMRQQQVTVPWQSVAAGICTRPAPGEGAKTRRYKDTAFVPGVGAVTVHKRESSRPRGQEVATASIALRNARGEVRGFDFNRRSADYAFLGADLQPSQAQNFSLFLRELARRAPHAHFTAGYLAMAGGNPRNVTRVNSRAERLGHLRWALCCAARS